jgi:hypothetical protein
MAFMELDIEQLESIYERKYDGRYKMDAEQFADLFYENPWSQYIRDLSYIPFDVTHYNCLDIVKRFGAISKDNDGFFSAASAFVKYLGFKLPKYQDLNGLFLRLLGVDFWASRISKKNKRAANNRKLESLEIKSGQFISKDALQDYRDGQEASYRYLSTHSVITPDGDRVSLLHRFEHSRSNPDIRNGEMMLQLRGVLDFATNDLGYENYFWTVTCPSKYHRYLKNGHPNPKWQHYFPDDSAEYHQKLWSRFRAACGRRGLRPMGFRVNEPHDNSCYHRHYIIACDPAHSAAIHKLMSQYALQMDGDEKGAAPFDSCDHLDQRYYKLEDGEVLWSDFKEEGYLPSSGARFNSKYIDPAKGDAAGYVAKYVSKNLGLKVGEGEKSLDFASYGELVTAQARLYGIRQFSFSGVPPIGHWREVFSMPQSVVDASDNEVLHALKQATNNKDIVSFIKIQKVNDIKFHNIEVENRYQETAKKVKGLVINGEVILTRLKDWSIVRNSDLDNADEECVSVDAALNIARADIISLKHIYEKLKLSRCSRSSLNNCTPSNSAFQKTKSSKFFERLEKYDTHNYDAPFKEIILSKNEVSGGLYELDTYIIFGNNRN